jgi:3-hydroxybutyryl-CoA dehydrogenase
MEVIERVGVVGLGTMGAGIVQVLLEGGREVVGRDVDDAALERARSRIEGGLDRRVEKGRLSDEERRSALARLALVRDLSGLSDCELVIEAIVEDIAAKRQLFAALDAIREQAILASNVCHLDHGDRRGSCRRGCSGSTSSIRRR